MKLPQSSISAKTLLAVASGLFFLIICGWFYYSYAENPQMPSIISTKKTAGFTIEADKNVYLNQPFKIKIAVDTNNQTVNAVGLTINYESDHLKIISLDTTQSFCQFYPEKKFNDNTGEINLSCGSPSPGFSGKNTIVTIEAMPHKMGSTSIVIDSTSKILRSDGKGTNLVSQFPNHQINIINSL